MYLLDGGDAHALVDCGMGTEAGMERVLARIDAAGIDPGGIGSLFLTHFHTDHAGGAARYRERLGLEVAIGRVARPASSAAIMLRRRSPRPRTRGSSRPATTTRRARSPTRWTTETCARSVG